MSMPNEVLSIAEKAEAVIHDTFTMKGDEFGFDIPQAMLVGINTTPNGEVKVQPELASHGDIYQLIDNVDKFTIQGFDALGLVTCGWAAPVSNNDDGETAPSQHPERRRVRLFMCVSRQGVASVLRFKDDSNNPITDEGEAKGPLAEAVLSLLD